MRRVFAGVIFASLLCAGAVTDRPRSDMEERLRSQYLLTKISALNGDVKEVGSILIVQRPDVRGGATSSSITPYGNNYENGRMKYGGWGAFLADTNALRTFNAGDRVYLTKLECKDTSINLQVLSTEPYDVGNISASVNIKFPKGYLMSLTIDQIQQRINEVLALEGASPGVEQPSVQMQPVPAQPAQPPPTIALGQTIDQVVAILGPPDKIVRLGPKEIYLYKDLKVTFQDGKVADVQ